MKATSSFLGSTGRDLKEGRVVLVLVSAMSKPIEAVEDGDGSLVDASRWPVGWVVIIPVVAGKDCPPGRAIGKLKADGHFAAAISPRHHEPSESVLSSVDLPAHLSP